MTQELNVAEKATVARFGLDRPERIQLRRTKGWRLPANTVVVARPSKWGNQFRVIGASVVGVDWFEALGRLGHRVISLDSLGLELLYSSHSDKQDAIAHAVDLFRTYCKVIARDSPADFEKWIEPLRGKNLACWCSTDKPVPCHADILLELANA